MIVELDDIVEELANKLGIYGTHPAEFDEEHCNCRLCWTMKLKAQIRSAVEIENALAEHKSS